jgi:hypothetical protein
MVIQATEATASSSHSSATSPNSLSKSQFSLKGIIVCLDYFNFYSNISNSLFLMTKRSFLHIAVYFSKNKNIVSIVK